MVSQVRPKRGQAPALQRVAIKCLLLFVLAPTCFAQNKPDEKPALFSLEHGAITRGDKSVKNIALVFTGDEFADGAQTIIRVLQQHRARASFFFTGRFYRNQNFRAAIQQLKRDGHYLGAHSDAHLLYCDWNDREKLLVSRKQFEEDLSKNYAAMHLYGISQNQARYFLPPFEWYNRRISVWTEELGMQLINFTSGTRSNADYTTPDMKTYVASEAIMQRIREYEAIDPAGLNGFLLLMHIGVAKERTDKFYDRLDELLDWVEAKGYRLVRVDQMLNTN